MLIIYNHSLSRGRFQWQINCLLLELRRCSSLISVNTLNGQQKKTFNALDHLSTSSSISKHFRLLSLILHLSMEYKYTSRMVTPHLYSREANTRAQCASSKTYLRLNLIKWACLLSLTSLKVILVFKRLREKIRVKLLMKSGGLFQVKLSNMSKHQKGREWLESMDIYGMTLLYIS